MQLFREIGGRLPGKRRVAFPAAFPVRTMTGRACGQAARMAANAVERRSNSRARDWRKRDGHLGIKERHFLPFLAVQALGNRLHLRMLAKAGGEVVHLTVEISDADSCQSRNGTAVATAIYAMAADAGTLRSCIAAAERNHLTRP